MRFPVRGYVALVVVVAVAIALLGHRLLRREVPAQPAHAVLSGRILYEAHCAVCHGLSGKGDGPGAKVVRQSFTDFSDPAAMRAVDDRFLIEITKKGGSQFGRSNAMPSWGMKLTDEEIRAIVAHIRSLVSGTPSGPGGRKETP
jgi:mono/diheme cytochrome c family protein